MTSASWCGKVVFTAEDATEWAQKGEKVILVRLETSPEDIEGMHYSQGILTVRGGMQPIRRPKSPPIEASTVGIASP